MILGQLNIVPWQPSDLRLYYLRYNRNLKEVREILIREEFSLYNIPTVFWLRDKKYKISVLSEIFRKLREKFNIIEDYNSLKPKEEIINIYRIERAREKIRERFQIRRDKCSE